MSTPEAVNQSLAELVLNGGSIEIHLADGGSVELLSNAYLPDPFNIVTRRKKGAHKHKNSSYATFDEAHTMLPRIATVLNACKELIA